MGKVKDENGKEALEEFTRDDKKSSLIKQPISDINLGIKAQAILPSESDGSPSPLTILDKPGPGSPTSADSRDDTLKIDEFKFLECSPIIPGQSEPEPCLICQPSPYAYVPEYRSMDHGEAFFNGKNCTQNIVLTFDFRSQKLDFENLDFIEEQKEIGIRLLLDYHNKSHIATIYKYEPKLRKKDNDYKIPNEKNPGDPILGATLGFDIDELAQLDEGPQSTAQAQIPPETKGYELKTQRVNMVDELKPYAKYEYHIPIQLNSRTRILISVPVEIFERAPEKLVSEPEAEFETNLEVYFDGVDFIPILNRVSRALKVYNTALKKWRQFDGGSLVEVRSASTLGERKAVYLNLEEEAQKIKEFRNIIKAMVEKKEIGLSFDPFRVGKIPEKIGFKFEKKGRNQEKLRIKQIVLNKPGCKPFRIGPNGKYKKIFREIEKNSPFKRTRTLYYIGASPDIDIDLQCRTPVPWLEVVTKYTYPPVEVFSGANGNTIYNEPSLVACFGKSTFADHTVDAFFEGMEDMLLNFPDAVIAEFSKTSCNTLEEHVDLKSKTREASDRTKLELQRFSEETKRSIALDNPYLDIVLEEIMSEIAPIPTEDREGISKPLPTPAAREYKRTVKKAMREHYRNNRENLWYRINNRLGWCGWIALLMQAIDCVAQGMGEESASRALVDTAIKSMDNNYTSRVFLGLTPQQQGKILESIDEEFKKYPPPWDLEYTNGNHSGFSASEEKERETLETELASAERRLEMLQGDQNSSEDDLINAENELLVARENSKVGPPRGTEDQDIRLVEDLFDAYKNAMIASTGAPELINQLNQLPGAPIVSEILKHSPCNITSSDVFGLESYMSFQRDFDFEVCQWDIDLTLPEIHSKIKNPWDLIHDLSKALVDVMLETAVAIMISALKLILGKIFSIACESLALLGTNLLDLFAGSDHFRNLLKDNMCPDASMEDLYDSLRSIFSTIGGPDSDCLENLTDSELAEFIDDISVMLTQGQVIELLTGTATEETINLATEVAKTSKSECISEVFSDPGAFQSFFPSLGTFLPSLEELTDRLAPGELMGPVYPCSPEVNANIEDLKCRLLQQKGLDPKQCREQLDDLKDQAIQDLNDLANKMQNGPFSEFPPMTSTDACNPEGFLPISDPLLEGFNQDISGIIFDTIESAHVRDLMGPINTVTGHGGVLNAVLSDTKGRPFKTHNWLVDHFGSPIAANLGIFEAHSDNAIKDPDSGDLSAPVDIYGRVLSGKEGKGKSFFKYSDGGYPPTIGSYLREQFLSMPSNMRFKTKDLNDNTVVDFSIVYVTYTDGIAVDSASGPGQEVKRNENANYEFELTYNYNLPDPETNLLQSDGNYRIKIIETHRSPSGNGELSRRELKKLGSEAPPPSILEDEDYTFTKYNLQVKSAIGDDISELIDQLPISENIEDSYEIEVFYKMMEREILSASKDRVATLQLTSVNSSFRELFSLEAFDGISSEFISKIGDVIATGNTSGKKRKSSPDDLSKREERKAEKIDLENISNGFKFGYDPYREPKIIYLDPEKYGGPLGRLFPDKIPPPFYVQERKHSGWMDFAAALVPEGDGCEPFTEPIFQLKDLLDTISELSISLPDDDRLQYDPLCAVESPFDKILTSYDAANMEGLIRAVVRIYTLDVFIRGIPTFVIFGLNEDNYDDALQQFVAERIKQGLYEDGKKPLTDRTDDVYYYRILEQAVNNTIRKKNAGILNIETDFSDEERASIAAIENEIARFYKKYNGELAELSTAAIKGQSIFKRVFSTKASSGATGIGSGSSRFSKKHAERAKEEAFIKVVGKMEKESTIILKRYIREEFSVLESKFREVLPPLVENIHHLFLINEDWIRGAASEEGEGPYHVMSDPYNSNFYSIEDNPTNWPFVLERYIKIEDKQEIPAEVENRDINLYNIVNINDWDLYIKGLRLNNISGNISDFWGQVPASGSTSEIDNHTHEYDIDLSGNGQTSVHVGEDGIEHNHMIVDGIIQHAEDHKHNIEIVGWKFGLRLSYMPEKDPDGTFASIVDTIGKESIINSKAFRLSSGKGPRYLIPIASAELDIPDQDISLFEPNAYDVYCLIPELIKTPEYKTMFEYVFPLARFTSIMAIYCVMAFFDSIGNSGYPENGGDMWEIPGGRPGKKFRKWVRGPEAFKDSRDAAMVAFTSFYEAAQAIDFQVDNKISPHRPPASLRELLRPRVNFEDGLRWWQRGRRVKGRPFNSNGEECPD